MARPKRMSKTTFIGIFLLVMAGSAMVFRIRDLIDGSDFSVLFGAIGLIGSGLIGIMGKDDDHVDHSAEIAELRQMIEELKNKDK